MSHRPAMCKAIAAIGSLMSGQPDQVKAGFQPVQQDRRTVYVRIDKQDLPHVTRGDELLLIMACIRRDTSSRRAGRESGASAPCFSVFHRLGMIRTTGWQRRGLCPTARLIKWNNQHSRTVQAIY